MNTLRSVVLALVLGFSSVANGLSIMDTQGKTITLQEIPSGITFDQLRKGFGRQYGMENIDFYDYDNGNFIMRDEKIANYTGKKVRIRSPFKNVPDKSSTIDARELID